MAVSLSNTRYNAANYFVCQLTLTWHQSRSQTALGLVRPLQLIGVGNVCYGLEPLLLYLSVLTFLILLQVLLKFLRANPPL